MQKIAKVIAPAIISLLLLSGCGTILKQAIDGGTDSVKGQFDKIVKDQNITAINRVTVNAAGVSVTYLKDGSYTTARLGNGDDTIKEDKEHESFINSASPDKFDVEQLNKKLDQMSGCEEAKRVAAAEATPTGELIQHVQCSTGFLSGVTKTFDTAGNPLPEFDNWNSIDAISAVVDEAKKYGGNEITKLRLTNQSDVEKVTFANAQVSFKTEQCTNGETCEATLIRAANLKDPDAAIMMKVSTSSESLPDQVIDLSSTTAKDIVNTIAKTPRTGNIPPNSDLSTILQIELAYSYVAKQPALDVIFSDNSRLSDAVIIKEGQNAPSTSSAPTRR